LVRGVLNGVNNSGADDSAIGTILKQVRDVLARRHTEPAAHAPPSSRDFSFQLSLSAPRHIPRPHARTTEFEQHALSSRQLKLKARAQPMSSDFSFQQLL
jgi:hypothetical protein